MKYGDEKKLQRKGWSLWKRSLKAASYPTTQVPMIFAIFMIVSDRETPNILVVLRPQNVVQCKNCYFAPVCELVESQRTPMVVTINNQLQPKIENWIPKGPI